MENIGKPYVCVVGRGVNNNFLELCLIPDV